MFGLHLEIHAYSSLPREEFCLWVLQGWFEWGGRIRGGAIRMSQVVMCFTHQP